MENGLPETLDSGASLQRYLFGWLKKCRYVRTVKPKAGMPISRLAQRGRVKPSGGSMQAKGAGSGRYDPAGRRGKQPQMRAMENKQDAFNAIKGDCNNMSRPRAELKQRRWILRELFAEKYSIMIPVTN